jgi:hypothetical protein
MPSHTLPTATPGRRITNNRTSSTAGALPRRLTPNTVVDLVNRGLMSIDDGDAAMKTLEQPRLKTRRQATFGVRIAIQVPADTRPGPAIARLNTTVAEAVSAMTWSQAVDDSPDGYAIDPPSPDGTSTVHAFLRLSVRVVAYRLHRFPTTARDLLNRDLHHLRQHGIQVRPRARRWHLREADGEEPWAWYDDRHDVDIHDFDGDGVSDEREVDDLDPVHYRHGRLYDEAELFDLDPFDPFQADPFD